MVVPLVVVALVVVVAVVLVVVVVAAVLLVVVAAQTAAVVLALWRSASEGRSLPRCQGSVVAVGAGVCFVGLSSVSSSETIRTV